MWFRIILGLLLSITITFAQTAVKDFKVKYISVDNIYLDSGATDGLTIGDTIQVMRSSQKIALLKVVYVAAHSASCQILSKKQDIVIGDIARAQIKKNEESQVSLDTGRRQRKFETNGLKKKKSKTRVSGYLSLQWYQYTDLANDNRYDFSQPTLRFKLNAKKLWDDEYYFRVKLRSRYNDRTRRYNSNVPQSEWRNRLYEVSFSYENKASALNYKAGRIISNKFSGLGYIDGLLLQHNITEKFGWGIFGGTQPEWQYSEFQTSFQKYGAFVSYEKGDYSTSRFETTLAAAGAYHGSTVSREFLYLQNSFNQGRKWNIYQSLELDVNRDWRKRKTGESLSMTGLYLSSRYYLTDDLSWSLSYDNRKNYYTYESRTLADSLFDDAFRQGARTSLSLRIARQYRLSASFGIRKRESGDASYSYRSALNAVNVFNSTVTASMRFLGFSNLYTEGINPSVSLSKYFNGGHSLRLNYGNYMYSLKTNNSNRENQFAGLDGQLELPLHMYVSSSLQYDWGDDSKGYRLFAELGYRF